ncbi:MAG: glycosyltransferase family 4 protein [Candidatus Nanopelagicales bacterium]
MRIAHVSDCYLPRTGGIETQVRGLALAQAARGDDVRIITATPGDGPVRAGRDVVDGLPVDRLAVRLPADLPVHPRTRAGVRALLESEPADVAHVHLGATSPFAWGALRALAQVDLPTVVTVHSVWGPLSRNGYRAVRSALLRPHVVVSAVSGMAASAVSSSLATDVAVLPNALDPLPWQREAAVPRVDGALRVVTVSRLAPRKRIGALLKAIARAQVLVGPSQRIEATIIGDGPQRALVERTARRLAIDVTFTGRLDGSGIREVFARSDAFVQASVRESFGIAALEARAAGLPVIARAQAGTAEFIRDGIEGLLAVDDASLASAIALLARDPGLGERLAAHNVSAPVEQTWDYVCARASALYADAGA